MFNAIKKKYNTLLPGKLEYVLIGIMLTVSFFCMYYSDITTTYEHGLELLESIFNNNFLGFYDYAAINSISGDKALYELPLYIIFAIWGLPVYILNKVFGCSIFCVGVKLWFKLLPASCVFICTNVFGKIANVLELNEERTKWLQITFLSSLFVIIPVFQIAQYDSICLVFILLGVLFYLRSKYKYFLIFFAIASPLKLFAVLLFIPLVLLKEKRIVYILRDFMIGISGELLYKIIFYRSPAYKAVGEFALSMLNSKLETVTLCTFNNEAVLLFFVIYTLICIWCYYLQLSSLEDFYSYSLFIMFISLLPFFAFADVHPYWIIILEPFLLLLVFYNKNWEINTILLCLFSTVYVCVLTLQYDWVFGASNTFSYLLLSLSDVLMNKLDQKSVAQFFADIELVRYQAMFSSILLACAIALVVINFPRKNKEMKYSTDEKMSKWLLWGHLLLPIIWTLLVFKVVF